MSIKLTDEIKELLERVDTIKILATVDEKGVPHAVAKDSVFAGEDGNLIILEIIESSCTNSNLVHSIWFKRKASVLLLGKYGESYQIKGTPVRCLISGPVFERYYREIREKLGDVDLASVWVIEPEDIRNETFKVRNEEEAASHPLILHLDRIAKN